MQRYLVPPFSGISENASVAGLFLVLFLFYLPVLIELQSVQSWQERLIRDKLVQARGALQQARLVVVATRRCSVITRWELLRDPSFSAVAGAD